MKIGLVVAIEIDAVEALFGTCEEIAEQNGQSVQIYRRGNHTLYVLRSGAGEIASAAATQHLITGFSVDLILNFGVVGALTEEMSKHRLSVVEKVVHYDYDSSEWDGCERGRYLELPDPYIPVDPALLKKATELRPDLRPVILASADRFVGDRDAKESIHRQFHADICDMEAAGIALTCLRNRIPCLMIKMVSDGIDGGVEEFLATLDEASKTCLSVMIEVCDQL